MRRLAASTLALTLALTLPIPNAQAQPFAGSSLPQLPQLPHIQVPAIPVPGVPGPNSSVGDKRQQLLDATNRYRASRGLPLLARHAALDNVAQNWSNHMAGQRRVQHNPNYTAGYPAPWRRAGENVGTFNREVSAQQMLQAWLDSPVHRRHLDNPHFTHIGLGWTVNAQGELYAAQNFAAF